MFLDPARSDTFKASLLNAIVAPRPIGWISTLDRRGVANLAPFSYFNAVSAAPPMVVFCSNQPADRQEKDTLANVREVPEFVANFASWALRESMNLSSAPAPRGISEFEFAGLTARPSTNVSPPAVAESPANLECTVVQIVDLEPTGPGERMSSLVIGRIVGVHLADEFVDENGRFDTAAARPVMRLGGFGYGTLGEVFDMPRPPWPLENGTS
jgi:flavin reductase (DIM6/NTAB) family NADH-FMN oxidoreductase RutF